MRVKHTGPGGVNRPELGWTPASGVSDQLAVSVTSTVTGDVDALLEAALAASSTVSSPRPAGTVEVAAGIAAALQICGQSC